MVRPNIVATGTCRTEVVHLTVDRKQRERKIFWGSGITFKVRPQ
jgi:hypothetical protein